MPTISAFYGILIQMFWGDHAPPHIHTLEVVRGSMPRRALALVLEWAFQHRAELLEDWTLCENNQLPKKISPLE